MCISSFSCAGIIFTNMVGGGGSNNKKDHATGKNPRCPLSFLFLFVLLQNTFNIDVFVPKLVKIVIFYLLFCSFLLFLPDLVNKMSSNREQKRTKKSCRRENCKMSSVFFVVGPPPPPLKHETLYYPILILNVISRAVNSKSLLHVIFGDFVKFHCLIQTLFSHFSQLIFI